MAGGARIGSLNSENVTDQLEQIPEGNDDDVHGISIFLSMEERGGWTGKELSLH